MSAPFALILAGGSGTRFWPLSRNARPKQLLPLFGETTLLEQSVRRLDGLVPAENILVLTNPLQLETARAACAGWLAPENVIAEPERRDTAPAIALAIGWVAARDPQGVMMVLPSDHLIEDAAAFRAALDAAVTCARAEHAIVTLGIKPTWACPGYGYIERGQRLAVPGLPDALSPFTVTRFREKPDAATAATYIEAGNFCWNAGMFVWSIPDVLAELDAHAPALGSFARGLAASPSLPSDLSARFGALPKISIDFALMEKASRVLNIEAPFDWDDVGSWPSVANHLPADESGNRANHPVASIESGGNIVFNARPGTTIALLGVDDLIIVSTDDALLVARRDQAERIKAIVDQVGPELH
jgi:mannose-1-phosphate guanylyltransferase